MFGTWVYYWKKRVFSLIISSIFYPLVSSSNTLAPSIFLVVALALANHLRPSRRRKPLPETCKLPAISRPSRASTRKLPRQFPIGPMLLLSRVSVAVVVDDIENSIFLTSVLSLHFYHPSFPSIKIDKWTWYHFILLPLV